MESRPRIATENFSRRATCETTSNRRNPRPAESERSIAHRARSENGTCPNQNDRCLSDFSKLRGGANFRVASASGRWQVERDEAMRCFAGR
jgi:hypothetical protein